MVFNFFNGGWTPRIDSTKALSSQIRRSLGESLAYTIVNDILRQQNKKIKKTSAQVKQTNIFQKFPLKVAMTSGCLSLAGDTLAQLNERFNARKPKVNEGESSYQNSGHDFLRSMRMSSYGFLLYAPGTQCWYQFLDKILVEQSLKNFSFKVMANQLVLGPVILFVVFGWNYLWMGKIEELPNKYKKDMIPSIVHSWKFWLPATCLNFGLIPLHSRVAFMSICGVFWNFYLSSKIGKL